MKRIKAKKEQDKSREKRQNMAAIGEWKKEIKEKGENARDLSDFMLNKKNQAPEFNKNGKGGPGFKGGPG